MLEKPLADHLLCITGVALLAKDTAVSRAGTWPVAPLLYFQGVSSSLAMLLHAENMRKFRRTGQ